VSVAVRQASRRGVAPGNVRRPAIATFAIAVALGAVAPTTPQEATFRARVSAVRLDVLVVHDGRPVTGLGSGDFEVLDNGVRQEVTAVYAERTPLDVVFALDRSGSVDGEMLAGLTAGVRATLEELREGDRAALLTFSHFVTMNTALEADRRAVAKAVESVVAGGGTAAIDAVYGALALAEGTGRRTLVLLFSDGFDNHSWLTPREIVRAARDSEVVVCGLAFTPPPPGRGEFRAPPHVRLLRELSEATGGEVLEVRDRAELAKSFVRILSAMRTRYLLTYSSRGGESRGWHELRVRLRRGPGKVVVRPGYFVR